MGLSPSPTQWVKDPSFAKLRLVSKLWLRSDPWPRNSICHGVAKKVKKTGAGGGAYRPTPELETQYIGHFPSTIPVFVNAILRCCILVTPGRTDTFSL